MNNIIIHLSDLHISDRSKKYGDFNTNTYLTDDEEKGIVFIHSLVESIKKVSCDNRYLIITGDITNIGAKLEFERALKYINILVDGLSIKKENILIIPGDHDISRVSITSAIKTKDEEGKDFEIDEVKYKNFQVLYKGIKGEEFDYNKLIFDKIEVDNLLILAVNSNDKVDHIKSKGYIPLTRFDNEMKSFNEIKENKHVLLAFHHNISGSYEDKRSGQWDLENRKDLLPYFVSHDVRCIFHGNEHTRKSEYLDSREIIISDAGSCASIEKPISSYKIYKIEISKDKVNIKNNIIQLSKVDAIGEPTIGDWVTQNVNDLSGELSDFLIFKKSLEKTKERLELPEGANNKFNPSNHQINKDGELKDNSKSKEPIYFDNRNTQAKLYEIIKNKKLYHSGHFHWSESSRAHNWIDVSKLLENKDDLYFVKGAIIELIEKFSLEESSDLIIGLGVEGNILASKASIKFDIPYTSLPYSYRYSDSHKYTKKLNFDNTKNKFKNVLIITDVVNNGRTIRQLIAEKEQEFFSVVDKITIISLFYTGHENIDIDIINYDNLSKDHDKENDFEVNNIDFYAVKPLRVEKCPYGKDYEKKCFIYKDDLSMVHLFYDENNLKLNL